MRLIKLSIAAAAFAVGSATVVQANQALNVANGTYTFEANVTATLAPYIGTPYTPPTTAEIQEFDGSWVHFANDTIDSWDLVDSTPIPGYLAGDAADYPPLTTANSSLFDFSTIPDGDGPNGPNAFSFEIASPLGETETPGSFFFYEGGNNVNDTSSLDGGFGGGGIDPVGTWTFTPDLTQNVVPDTADTFQLLFGVLTAMGACKAFFASRSAARR